MKIPIQYAFSYPDRFKSSFRKLDIEQLQNLQFIKPEFSDFPNLLLAFVTLAGHQFLLLIVT